MDIRQLKSDIKSKKGLSEQDYSLWSFIQKPIGKAYYKHHENEKDPDDILPDEDESDNEDNDEIKIHWSDKLKCKVCGRQYTRSNVSNHKKSQYHKAYEKINDKVRKFILAE